MSVENVVYGLVAGAIVVMVGFAMRPNRDGQRAIADDRRKALGWFLAAAFVFVVLQLAGAGREFAIASGAAGALILLYLLSKRATRKLGR